MSEQTKQCSKCGEIKSVSEYYKSKRGKCGVRGDCKVCVQKYESSIADRISARKKRHRQDNKELYAERSKIYRREYREKIAAWRKENRDRLLLEKKRWYQDNKERLVPQKKDYQMNNLHVFRSSNQRRRARKLNSDTGTVTPDVIKALQEVTKQCPYCHESLEGKTTHIDHVVPLAKGGLHDAANLVVCCDTCNLSKGANLPSQEFMEITQ